MRDRFNQAPPVSSSRDRYSSMDHSSNRSGEYGSRASGYLSDAGSSSLRSYGTSHNDRALSVSRDYSSRAPSVSRDYGSRAPSVSRDYGSRAPSVSRDTGRYGGYNSTASRESSPVRTSSRSTRDFTSSTRDLGSTYAREKEKARQREYAPSAYEQRRARTSDYNLTAFSSRLSRQNSEPSLTSRQPSKESISSKKSDSESSDSIAESEMVSDDEMDPDFHYVVERGTYPKGEEPEEPETRKKKRIGKKSISKTKIKLRQKKVYERRRDRPVTIDNSIQVNVEELEKNCRRSSRYGSGSGYGSRYSSGSYGSSYGSGSYGSTYGTSGRYGGGGSSYGTTYTGRSSYRPGSSSYSSYKNKDEVKDSRRSRIDSTESDKSKSRHSSGSKENKQSAFVPKSRQRRSTLESDDEVFNHDTKLSSSEEEEEIDIPMKQSSFFEKQQQRTKLTPENLSLKDSIDKVRSWKKQLTETPPDSPVSPVPGGGRSPRSGKGKLMYTKSSSGDSVFMDEDDDAFNKEYRKSQLNMSKKKSARKSGSSSDAFSKGKMYAGVPQFPVDTEEINGEVSPRSKKKVLKIKIDRSPSPYDNFLSPGDKGGRSPSPYDNMGTPKVHPSKSMESIEDAQDEEQARLNRTQSMMSIDSIGRKKSLNHAKSMDSLSTATSLPDLVQPDTCKKKHSFISAFTDIDSFLDFTETEDDFDDLSDEEDKKKKEKQTAKTKSSLVRPSKQKGTVLASLSEDPEDTSNKKSTKRQSTKDSMPEDDDYYIYIGDWRDIDEVLSDDTEANKDKLLNGPKGQGQKLTLRIPLPDIQLGSIESLMDTPVPQTPDLPLSPLPSFPNSPTTSKNKLAQSMDQGLNQVGQSSKLSPDEKKANKQRVNKAKSVSTSNLDDLDSLLEIVSKAPARKKDKRTGQTDQAATFELFKSQSSTESINKSPSVDIPTGQLIDLSFASHSLGDKKLPENYSNEAVNQTLALQKTKGKKHITITELLDICKKEKDVKPPWMEEDDVNGMPLHSYTTMVELLDDMGVDCKKVL